MDKFCQQQLPRPGARGCISIAAVPTLKVHLYRPRVLKNRQRLLVVVHGISRNTMQQLDIYSELANELGLWLIAPAFSTQHFSGYQQLAKGAGQPRADLALNRFLLAWAAEQQLTDLKLHLCGYSGGAQFAHRYALVYPSKVASLVLSSAGWYSFPDSSVSYPRGLGKWPIWLTPPNLNELLRLSMLVLVGDQDVQRDSSLKTTARLDQQQGLHRLERARRWVDAISQLQQQLQVTTGIAFHRLQRQAHDFSDNARHSDMLSVIGQFWKSVEQEGV
ncbi:MAG: alpha/beta fold hydrolase [Motiliproteus sp.]